MTTYFYLFTVTTDRLEVARSSIDCNYLIIKILRMINEWEIMQKDITFTIFNLNAIDNNLYDTSLKIFPAFSYHAVVHNFQTHLYLHF